MLTLIANANGHVDFQNTRQIVVSSSTFSIGTKDFGAGPELYTECPHCKRRLPTAVMHVDHIQSQARHAPSMMGNHVPVEVRDLNFPHGISTTHLSWIQGGICNIDKIGQYSGNPMGQAKPIHTKTAWQCDLTNLQWLCPVCNTSKGANDFDQWSPRPAKPFANCLNVGVAAASAGTCTIS
jgi:rubredoxin